MDLALVGTGRMGTAVEEVALERGHRIVSRFSSERPLSDDAGALEGADVVVDFSLPEVAATHIDRYCRWRVPAVIGTTGWHDRVEEVAGRVREHDACILYAPNFSIGIAMLAHALRAVTPLLDRLPEYDPYIHEVHHVNKVDSPSGTALMLGQILVDALDRKGRVETETQHGRIDDAALHVTSSRAGAVIGEHRITLDSPFDSITLEHRAKNRKGFAFGAVKAAEWLPGRQGMYRMEDMLADLLDGRKAG